MFKSKTPEKEKDTTANVAEVVASTVQQQHSVVEQPSPGARSPEDLPVMQSSKLELVINAQTAAIRADYKRGPALMPMQPHASARRWEAMRSGLLVRLDRSTDVITSTACW